MTNPLVYTAGDWCEWQLSNLFRVILVIPMRVDRRKDILCVATAGHIAEFVFYVPFFDTTHGCWSSVFYEILLA